MLSTDCSHLSMVMCPQGRQELGEENEGGSLSCRFLGLAESLHTPALLRDVSLDNTVPPAAPQNGFPLPPAAAQPYSCSAFFYKQLTFFFFASLCCIERLLVSCLYILSPQLPALLTPPFCVGSFGPMNRAGGPLPAGPQALTSLSLLCMSVRWV